MEEDNSTFFHKLWTFTSQKHEQGVYNTVCLVVLLILPLMVLLTLLAVCCHCCCCTRDSITCKKNKSEKKKIKKNKNVQKEDLWISIDFKADPLILDTLPHTVV